MGRTYRVAGAQIDIALMEVAHNLARMEEIVRQGAKEGTWLTIFPECALAGYCYESLEEALPFAEPIPGPSTEKFAALCRECHTHVIVGMIERDGERVFNAAALIGPNGVIGHYRKIHLPYLGIDRFATPGDRPFQVWDVEGVRVGIHICYDGAFPESARVMTLLGADIIVLPTNWPPKSECAADHLVSVRALENVIYYMSVDRVGEERGFAFVGGSKLCDPMGNVIAEAPGTAEKIFVGEIDPEVSRKKKLIRRPGLHEIDRIQDRRPEFYGEITKPITRSRG